MVQQPGHESDCWPASDAEIKNMSPSLNNVVFNKVQEALGDTRWRKWLRHFATSRRRVAGLIPMVSLEFLIDIFLPVAPWPWG